MAKTKKSKQRNRASRPSREPKEALNSRPVESITVIWMLCIVLTVLAEVVSISTGLVVKWSQVQWPQTFQILPGLMLAIATITGGLAVFLTFVTNRLRRDPPPLAVSAFALVIGSIPVITMVALTLSGG